MPAHTEGLAWLRFAQDDLAAAKMLLAQRDLPARLACFHAQQAAEKALKASLLHASTEFRKTHDLVVLAGLQPAAVQADVTGLDLQQLQQWAVDARYPADLPDISAEEAAIVLGVADRSVCAIAEFLMGETSA